MADPLRETNSTVMEHYRRLLELPTPWEVRSVSMDVDKRTVAVEISYPLGTMAHCSECGQLCSVKDRRKKRWRHLSQMSFQTQIECEVPRTDCTEHDVLQILVPWAEPHGRFTLEFEAFAILVLERSRSIDEGSEILGISWDAAQSIMRRAVLRGQLQEKEKKVMPHLGMDEKSFLKGQSYATVLSDIKGGRVLEVVEGRDEEAAKTALACLSPKQRDGVEAVATDFWEAFGNAVKVVLPKAEQVHDRYHATTYLTKAVDKVRRAEHKTFQAEGNQSLKGTKYVWLTSPENWRKDQREVFRALRSDNLKVGRAFAIKEQFRSFWNYTYAGAARNFYKSWHFWATHSRLKPIREAAMTLWRHQPGLFAYFKHRISNAVAEGLNSKIQLIKSGARGFRNFQNYRTAILFHCGGLNMRPHSCR